MSKRFAALIAYLALTATFLTATILSQPETPTVAMSSMSLEKTNRLPTGTPGAFVTERFAS